MSVCDSPEELAAARASLATASPESLHNDLAYWSVAALDAADDYDKLRGRIDAIATQQHVARAWVGLVAVELQSRRGRSSDATTS